MSGGGAGKGKGGGGGGGGAKGKAGGGGAAGAADELKKNIGEGIGPASSDVLAKRTELWAKKFKQDVMSSPADMKDALKDDRQQWKGKKSQEIRSELGSRFKNNPWGQHQMQFAKEQWGFKSTVDFSNKKAYENSLHKFSIEASRRL